MRTMNPIPFGAPEDAYDTSMDNYLTECDLCGEQEWRDDLDEHLMCDECVAIGEHAAIINATMDARREAIADAEMERADG
jgi:acetyl-CoA carboxylase beta subunit